MRSDNYLIEFDEKESSLIKYIKYNEDLKELEVGFYKYYTDKITYVNVEYKWFQEFSLANSKGRFYLNYIKKLFTQKTQKMADKIIKCKINVREIIKEWIFSGEKGDYLNFTILYNEKQTVKEFNGRNVYQNGMIVQDVPSKIYKEEAEKRIPADKLTKGPILGNCVEFKSGGGSIESAPGVESGVMRGEQNTPVDDDLPF